MSEYRGIWDRMLPLPLGTRVRYVRNRCRLKFRKDTWFKARGKAIGREGSVDDMFPPESPVFERYFHFYRYFKKKNLYLVHLDRPVGEYGHFYCTRDELEII